MTLKDIWPTLGSGLTHPSEYNPSHTKSGPGRKHQQGKPAKAEAPVEAK